MHILIRWIRKEAINIGARWPKFSKYPMIKIYNYLHMMGVYLPKGEAVSSCCHNNRKVYLHFESNFYYYIVT